MDSSSFWQKVNNVKKKVLKKVKIDIFKERNVKNDFKLK